MTTPKLARDAGYPQGDLASPAGAAATEKGEFDGRGPFLLGIAGSVSDRTAILLMKNGEVVSAKRGEKTPSGTVLAVGDSQVQIRTTFGHVLALTFPD